MLYKIEWIDCKLLVAQNLHKKIDNYLCNLLSF